MAPARRYDVAVVGAGTSGCSTALACAARGDSVLLLEKAPSAAAEEMVGEWLHPPAMDALESLGVDLLPTVGYPTGKGFAVHPEDGSSPIVLPYRRGRFGFSLGHDVLIETLRAHAAQRGGIDYREGGKAIRVEGNVIAWEERDATRSAQAERVVCATGSDVQVVRRGDVVSFGALERPATHRLASLELVGAALPFEGYFHLFVGGIGPAVAYRVAPSIVRLSLDVPLSLSVPRDGGVALFEGYAPALPSSLVDPFAEALRRGPPRWCGGRIVPRGDLARGGVARVGDAAGSLHPLTAVGPGLGIGDAITFSKSRSVEAYRHRRKREVRVSEAISIGLAELFTDSAPEIVAIRRASYRMWRRSPNERLRSMGLISGEPESVMGLGRSFLRVALSSAADVAGTGLRSRTYGHANRVGADMLTRIGWMVGGTLGWTDILPDSLAERIEARGAYGRAIHVEPQAEVVGLPRREARASVDRAVEAGARALMEEQAADGSFEGEIEWCPMLAAQYVLAMHVMDRPIDPTRQARLLTHFSLTRLAGGSWGMHARSEPYLFVTTLVYVAARLLGVADSDPLLLDAKAFIRGEGGAIGIPTWGKLWLALVGLYEWEGVNPILPELWTAPRWMPIHPTRYHCHTRLIYLGMATLYGARVGRPATPAIRTIQGEIFLSLYDEIDFARARETLRERDVSAPPSPVLRWTYRALSVLDRTRSLAARRRVLGDLRERIRDELRSTSHTAISPVSGLLDVLALWSADPEDPDVEKALATFDGWVWEDDEEGARVCGARSATWDTALAVNTLLTMRSSSEIGASLRLADRFLAAQQVRTATVSDERSDPRGGYSTAGAWHGWPTSECTAEVMVARLESPEGRPSAHAMTAAAEFVMRCQNADGGFGSYEARRVDVPIDWLNPSEMFAGSMTERSYVECTASALAGLAAFRRRFPNRARARVDRVIERGVLSIRAAQRPDGSFAGTWGVHFIYGTFFAVRGLVAGGVPSVDPQIQRACAWLKERQRPDGGWGEHFSSVEADRYVEHEEGQAVQTAWALIALLEAREPDFDVLERAARFLANAQSEDGTWPKQDPEGVFFHTALLHRRLYRQYFPPWALSLYQRRAAERATRLSATRHRKSSR